jgi:hypothetical protein
MQQHPIPLTIPRTDAQPETSLTSPRLAVERAYPDWRKRLLGNLSRRSDWHWDPLTDVETDGPVT